MSNFITISHDSVEPKDVKISSKLWERKNSAKRDKQSFKIELGEIQNEGEKLKSCKFKCSRRDCALPRKFFKEI